MQAPAFDAKQILVTGGLMRSHHLAVVPVVEGLVERGHNVTFVLPNTTEAHQWFPNGVGGAYLVYIGETFKVPDTKNLKWHERVLVWGNLIWNLRSMLGKPFFSVVDDFVHLIEHNKFDGVFSGAMSIGCNAVLKKRASIPWISFMTVPAYPEFVLGDSEQACKYPNLVNPRSLPELKGSLLKRVQNRVECMMLQAYIKIIVSVFNLLLKGRGFETAVDHTDILLGARTNVMLGGPPLTLPIKLPVGSHVVGTVEKPKPRSLPTELGSWLDDAGKAPVVYASMGTQYDFTNSSAANLVAEFGKLTLNGFRILWSLRASQQESLKHLLPHDDRLRVEEFTPQPEVLGHPAVKAFLSHCGWGGVTDTLAAGVPVLAYPSFADQRGSAQRLVELGAAVLVKPDFSNLVEAANAVVHSPVFADATRAAAADLHSLGGLQRTLDLVEEVAEGHFPDPLPQVQEKMDQVDPLFLRDQGVEKALSMSILVLVVGVLLCCGRMMLWCCCSCGCCCSSKPPAASHKKTQ